MRGNFQTTTPPRLAWILSAAEGFGVKPGGQPGVSPAERYRRELRELLVAVLDFRRIPRDPPPTRNPGLRADCLLAAEHVSETYLAAIAPPAEEARGVWAEVADDILGCVERGEWKRLWPTEWSVRVKYGWWFEMSWLARAWYRLWGGRRPEPGGRPLREVLSAEPGAAADPRRQSGSGG